jgi:hypothetical protein
MFGLGFAVLVEKSRAFQIGLACARRLSCWRNYEEPDLLAHLHFGSCVLVGGLLQRPPNLAETNRTQTSHLTCRIGNLALI